MEFAIEGAAPTKYVGIQDAEYYLIQTIPQFKAFLAEAKKQSLLTVDTETSGLEWFRDHVCGISIGWGPSNNFYLPIAHITNDKQLSIDAIRDDLNDLFFNPDLLVVMHNAKFDTHGLRQLGVHVRSTIVDVLSMSFLCDENISHALKDLAVMFIDKNADKWEKIIHEWRTGESRRRRTEFTKEVSVYAENLIDDPEYVVRIVPDVKRNMPEASRTIPARVHQAVLKFAKEVAKAALVESVNAKNSKDDVTYDYIPLDLMTPYACADVHYTWLLYKKYLHEITEDRDLVPLHSNETQMIRVLLKIEAGGCKIDRPYLMEVGPRLDKEADEVAEGIYRDAGKRFNIRSNPELVQALRENGVELTKLTAAAKKRQQEGDVENLVFSIDKEVLDGLAIKYPFAARVATYRGLLKTRSTYVDGILSKLDGNDFVHPNFNANVSTGRLSSNSPNFQNIPARDKVIRRAVIVPSDEYIFISMDLSQIELRLTAFKSKDKKLMSCYPMNGPGQDVHSLTCAEVVMGITLDEFSAMKKDTTGHQDGGVCMCPACVVNFMRNIAKRVNFLIIYGGSEVALQQQVSTPARFVSREDCKKYIDGYLQKYEGVRQWMDLVRFDLSRYHKVQTTFGRYRRFPTYPKEPTWMKERMERQAINSLIQSEAADLFKYAAVRIDKILEGRKTRIVNLVHDEIQFYWHRDELDLIKPVKHAMEYFPQYDVPIVAEVSISKTDWSTKKSIKA